jgi:antitoxin MazE
METYMKVAKWGNSLAVRLPQEVVERLCLKEGDEIELRAANDAVYEVARKPTPKELFDRIAHLRGTMPADYKFDREELHERGGRNE